MQRARDLYVNICINDTIPVRLRRHCGTARRDLLFSSLSDALSPSLTTSQPIIPFHSAFSSPSRFLSQSSPQHPSIRVRKSDSSTVASTVMPDNTIIDETYKDSDFTLISSDTIHFRVNRLFL